MSVGKHKREFPPTRLYALRRPQRLPDASDAYGHGQLPSYEDTESTIITFLISSLERSESVHRISPTMTDAIAPITAISPTTAYRTRLPPNDQSWHRNRQDCEISKGQIIFSHIRDASRASWEKLCRLNRSNQDSQTQQALLMPVLKFVEIAIER